MDKLFYMDYYGFIRFYKLITALHKALSGIVNYSATALFIAEIVFF